MPNKLIHETSPYLLQHAYNPVDWHAWGPEALERAKTEDKPILLSIGYSACHWCHVMERESFEDPEIAALMNEHYVNIKVDREERPDLDAIYMTAVQAMTGRGGWPMTVFLTPDQAPFYGGTYFPPVDHPDMPAFRRVLMAAAQAFQTRRTDVEQSGLRLREAIAESLSSRPAAGELSFALLDDAAASLVRQTDAEEGGFGVAPKFPQAMALDFLLQTYLRTRDETILKTAEHTLEKMARGGIYDHLGGGFHRYSTDNHWLAPHFEKMLYDNAILSRTYLHAYQITGKGFYRRVTEETLDYVLREMTSTEGGFYATQDADSEGEEGKFYIWSSEEIEKVLGAEQAGVFNRYYSVTKEGNFERRNILFAPESAEKVASELGISMQELELRLAEARAKLLTVRSQRVWPGLDDKVVTAWNGLMLRSMAEAGAALGRPDYVAAAEANAGFILRELLRDRRLLRTYRNGQAKLNGYLEDYSCVAAGLLALYEATFDLRWYREAAKLAETMIERFWDESDGCFYDTSNDHESLISRPRETSDNATPSGNSVAAEVLLRLNRLTGKQDFFEKAGRVLGFQADYFMRYSLGFGHLLGVAESYLAPSQEIAIVGDPENLATRALLSVVRTRYLPHKVIGLIRDEEDEAAHEFEFMEGRRQVNGNPTAYLCENYVCQMPVTEPEALAAQLDGNPGAPPSPLGFVPIKLL